ncbi:hypothetical protein [Paraburkholderia sp. RL17-337-BIB-A]|uniref:hypothetical protein n=1 Tax=Paraburkholderia sp. RL17-337-BIB-A TaxID=3031636 RepID=UPI0038BA1FA6
MNNPSSDGQHPVDAGLFYQGYFACLTTYGLIGHCVRQHCQQDQFRPTYMQCTRYIDFHIIL